VTAPQRPRARGDLTVVELDGEAVVYDEATGNLHHLNPTATLIFSRCDGTATAAEISEELAAAFGLPREEIEPQVRRLLRALRRAELLERPDGGNGRGRTDRRDGRTARSRGGGGTSAARATEGRAGRSGRRA
jgi:PqqD family protein of HPr-rel-A system